MKSGSTYYLRPSYGNDALTWTNGSAYPLLNAPNAIEIYWKAATSAGANNGVLILWINAVQKITYTTLDTDTLRLESANFQFLDSTSSSGTLYFDAFTAWADSPLAHERKYYDNLENK